MAFGSRVPRPRLLDGAESSLFIDQTLGITDAVAQALIPALDSAFSSRNTPGDLAPGSFPGMRAWGDGTVELRRRLIRFGWHVPQGRDLDQAGMVLSPDRESAIALVSSETAGRLAYAATVRYERGDAYRNVNQGVLCSKRFPEERPSRLIFLLHNLLDDRWDAELSLPVHINDSGFVQEWEVRAKIEFGPGGTRGDTTAAVPSPPGLPTPRVKWKTA